MWPFLLCSLALREVTHLFISTFLRAFVLLNTRYYNSTRSRLRVLKGISRVVFGCLRLTAVWRARRPHTPHQKKGSSILRAVVSCEELQLSASTSDEVQTFSCWGLFFLVSLTLRTPNFDQFRLLTTTAAPLSRGVGRC